jgi:hypothetical protein
VADQRRAHELEVFVPSGRSEREARRKLDVCLASWQTSNVGVETYVLEAVQAV